MLKRSIVFLAVATAVAVSGCGTAAPGRPASRPEAAVGPKLPVPAVNPGTAAPSPRSPSAPASPSPGGPRSSGKAAPAPPPTPATAGSGWTLAYEQDFSGTSLPADWGAYNGTPGGYSPQVANWEPSMCQVSGGYLHFMASGIHSCGVGSWVNPQKYGMYLVRMKGDSEPGLNFSDIALLWPADNSWPPEMDFYEDGGGSRSGYTATLHPGPAGDNSGQAQESESTDATAWHVYGVAWTPATLTFTIDGHQIGKPVTPAQTSGRWPSVPMVLDLQSQNLSGSGAPSARETMTVDWIQEYAYTP